MKLKEFARIFFTDLDIVVRDKDVIAVPHTTADKLALSPDFKDLRDLELVAVRTYQDHVMIIVK